LLTIGTAYLPVINGAYVKCMCSMNEGSMKQRCVGTAPSADWRRQRQ